VVWPAGSTNRPRLSSPPTWVFGEWSSVFGDAAQGGAGIDRSAKAGGEVVQHGDAVAIFEQGSLDCDPDRLFVHACADGVPRKGSSPIFQDGRLTPQFIRRCAPVFAAALIARVDSLDLSDEKKNDLCQPVPMVDAPEDWLQGHLVEVRNRARCAAQPAQAAAFSRSRSVQPAGYVRMADLLAAG